MKKLSSLLFIIVILIGLVQFYLKNVSVVWSFEGETYRTEFTVKDESNHDTKYVQYIYFNDGKMYNIITDEYHTSSCLRTIYDYSIHVWDNLGPIYFRTDNILSATTNKYDGKPITLIGKCIQSRGFNTINFIANEDGTYSLLDEPYFYTFESNEEVGKTISTLLVAKEDSFTISEDKYVKIAENNEELNVIKELARLYLDNEDMFKKYYEETYSS